MRIREVPEFIESKKRGIVSLISPSSGIRKLLIEAIRAHHANSPTQFIVDDARRSASMPLIWLNHFIADSSDHPDVSSSGCLPDFFAGFSGKRILTDHAEDLDTLSHFRGWRDFWEVFREAVSNSGVLWILLWYSGEQIPKGLTESVREIDLLGPDEIRSFCESRNINLSLSAVTECALLTGGYPEYVSILGKHLKNTDSHLDVRHTFSRLLKEPESALYQACQSRWYEILLLAKGYGMIKSLMERLAFHPQSRLVSLAKALRCSLPAIRDYLHCLIKVGAVTRQGFCYKLADPVLEAWLHETAEIRSFPMPSDTHKAKTNDSQEFPPSEKPKRRDDILDFD